MSCLIGKRKIWGTEVVYVLDFLSENLPYNFWGISRGCKFGRINVS